MSRNGCDAADASHCSDNGGGAGGNAADGCIYPDEEIMEKGITFSVRYTGCVEVKASMKSLDFSTRTQVARECINRVCESAGLKSAGVKRRVDKKILQFISERPCMRNAGTNVIINVSSRALQLINEETGDIIASHNMPRISFASGGDSETLDFLAYIAKDEKEWRACYVLECFGGQSEDLIVTIGKAFMLRYNALNAKAHQPSENYNVSGKENEKDYYNDMPDKLPPDLLTDPNDLPPQMHQQLQQRHHHQQQQHQQHFQQPKLPPHKVSQLNLKKPRDRLSSNLIDLNSPPPDQTTNKMNLSSFDPIKDQSHGAGGGRSDSSSAAGGASGAMGLQEQQQQQAPVRDVFDLQPFSLSAEVQRSQLLTESWFHPSISRPIAESLLKNDGDFLVRESQGKCGQYVLTGLEGKNPKHLLLIDPEGLVRTIDRIFDSVSHLIRYHWTNALPIISEDSELVLRNPVMRSATLTSSAAAPAQPLSAPTVSAPMMASSTAVTTQSTPLMHSS